MKVYAKLGTSEKAIVWANISNVDIMNQLNEADRGNWVLVDMLEPMEVIKFNDGIVYKGFSPEIKRYFKQEKLK